MTALVQDVEAPHLTQPRISLLTAATIVNDPSRWENGYSFDPEGCANGGLWDRCANPDGAIDPEYIPALKTAFRPPAQTATLPATVSLPTVTPLIVYTSVSRNTFSLKDGRDVSKLFDRAERDMSIVTSWYLEEQLWNDSAGGGNPKLQDATVIDPSFVLTPNDALAELELAIAACKAGGNMMIHMRPNVLMHILGTGSGAIRRVGNVYMTAMDTIVVPGRGYPGSSPANVAAGQTEWMYASPQVQVRLRDNVYLPERTDDLDVLRKAMDRTTNDVTVYIERFASATFDPECCLYAIEVTRPVDITP